MYVASTVWLMMNVVVVNIVKSPTNVVDLYAMFKLIRVATLARHVLRADVELDVLMISTTSREMINKKLRTIWSGL